MNGEALPVYEGYAFSRYKNTSDVTWQIAMDAALEKKRAAQSSGEGEQLMMDI